MKSVGKSKKLPLAALLPVAVLSALIGCATPWKAVRTEYKPTGIERKVVIKTTPEKEKIIEFDISEPYMEDGEHEVRIDKSLVEINSDVRVVDTEEDFRGYLVERREVPNEYATRVAFGTGILGFGALGAAIGIGVVERKEDVTMLQGALRGGIAAALFGSSVAGVICAVVPKTTETRKIRTDETKSQLSNSRTTERVPQGEVVVYQDKPASDISVKLSGDEEFKMYTTDDEGELNVSRFIDLLNSQYFFRNYTDKELEKRIGNIALVQQIKPRTLETLMEDLMQVVSPKEVRVTASTEEESSEEQEVKNDSRTFNLKGMELTDEAIYDVVRQFVDEKINSNIKSLSFIVRDNVTRVPIKGSNFEFELYAPRKEDLAGEYFTQGLRDYAQGCIRNYLERDMMVGDLPSKVFFDIYSPAMVRVEITNPDYHFVSGTILMGDEDLEKEVYMVDKGSKIRVQDADNERGRIE